MPSNRRAIAGGAAVTTVTTLVLVIGLFLLPIDDVRMVFYDLTGIIFFGNPFKPLRFLAGIPGGLLAGYFSRADSDYEELTVAAKIGIYATLLGLVGIFLLVLVGELVYSLVTGQTSVFYSLSVVVIITLSPFVPVYLVEGATFGPVGNVLRRW